MTTDTSDAFKRNEHKIFAGLNKTPAWVAALSMNDWLLDGEPIRREEQKLKFGKLDWLRAYMDMGPSPAGNPGPYWHVPWYFDGDESWARLYPKVMQTKWAPLIQQAMREAIK